MDNTKDSSRLQADKRRFLKSLVGAALACPVVVHAKQLVPFPRMSSRQPLRIVVPFAPGGTSDIVARLLAARLPDELGQPVVVENRAGAGGNIGIVAVARAPSDGRTLLLASSSFVTNPALPEGVHAYDPIRQFAPVCLAATSPDVIVVKAQSPLQQFSDLLDAARRDPGAMAYSTPGTGNSVHLAAELLWQRAGIKMLHVPYSGAGPAVTAVLGGQVDCGLAALPAVQAHLEAGTLRALVVGSKERWESLPQVPTLSQSGFVNFHSETMQAVLAPVGVSESFVVHINEGLRRVLTREDVSRQMRAQGFRVIASSPQALAVRIAEEVPRWKSVAATAGLRAD
ncbi:Bug family tripartite tricarboxylate transporter substrate binding protein [Achromobacter pestifer]